jgi:hypothetical protein
MVFGTGTDDGVNNSSAMHTGVSWPLRMRPLRNPPWSLFRGATTMIPRAANLSACCSGLDTSAIQLEEGR